SEATPITSSRSVSWAIVSAFSELAVSTSLASPLWAPSWFFGSSHRNSSPKATSRNPHGSAKNGNVSDVRPFVSCFFVTVKFSYLVFALIAADHSPSHLATKRRVGSLVVVCLFRISPSDSRSGRPSAASTKSLNAASQSVFVRPLTAFQVIDQP